MNLIIFQGLTNGKVARSLKNYATEDAALAAMYHELWSAVSNQEVASLVCVILADDGETVKREAWSRVAEEG